MDTELGREALTKMEVRTRVHHKSVVFYNILHEMTWVEAFRTG